MSLFSFFGKKKQPVRKSRKYVIVNEDISFAAGFDLSQKTMGRVLIL